MRRTPEDYSSDPGGGGVKSWKVITRREQKMGEAKKNNR